MAENRVGKRSNGDDDDDGSIKPLRKMRAISGYNLWHAEFMKTAGMYVFLVFFINYIRLLPIGYVEAKSLPTFSEKNQESARQWNLLSEQDKQCFREKAASTEANKQPVNLKQQITKILSHLQDLVSKYHVL